MPRVKRATIALKRRRKVLKAAKGYRFDRSKKERAARTAILHAGVHAFTGRRDKKNDFRRLWQIRLGAAVKPYGLSYSRFINLLAKKGITLDRKVLSELAQTAPETFSRIVDSVKA